MIRPEVNNLVLLGKFPASREAVPDVIKGQEQLLSRIIPPLSDDEVRELIKLFGPDDYYGCAWTMLHLIESAANWPLTDCLTDSSNEWVDRLRKRALNADPTIKSMS